MLKFALIFSVCILGAFGDTSTTSAPGNNCGLPVVIPDTNTNIVGGKEAIPYSWPWQVALYIKPLIGAAYQFCGGTVIAPQWIMTAGHCFYGKSDPSPFTVKIGVFNKTRNDEPGEIVSTITEFHIHPKYNPNPTPTYDITLLKLKDPIDYTNHIIPVCLPDQDEPLPDVGAPTWVTGWGTTREGGQTVDDLEEVSVPIVSDDDCKKAYPFQFSQPTQFCAGYQQGGKDSCQGDSGGPVVFQDQKTGTWKQFGIVSWGRGCAEPNYPGVYSKVSAYIDFIKQYVPNV